MGDFELPALAVGITVLIGFLSTYFIAFLNGVLPFVKESWQKKIVTVVVAVVMAGVSMLLYYAITGEAVPQWPVLVVLSLLAVSASYALLTKNASASIEAKVDKNA